MMTLANRSLCPIRIWAFGSGVMTALAGFASYRDGHTGRAFTHTEITADYEGLGLASQLIRYALDESRSGGRKVRPFCPFVRSVFLAEARRNARSPSRMFSIPRKT